MDSSQITSLAKPVKDTISNKKKRTFLIIGIIIIIALLTGGAVSYFLNVRSIFSPPSQSFNLQQQEYKNPFQKTSRSQYENPFSEYQNPFEELK